MENSEDKKRAVLVGVASDSSDADECEKSLDELSRLLDTAGGCEFARMIQVKSRIEPATYIGSGKLIELADLCDSNDVELVVFDTDLSPSQLRNIEDALKSASVIDRSMLILDIFALHAVTAEGKLQVELAQLKYTAPRLIGKGSEMSRLGGGIGTRGPGESKLESDRRHLSRRIDALESQLADLEHNRATMRAARDRSGLPKVAIVGYTNVGKSTLLNYLTNAGVLSENKLFATLDPTTRRLELPMGDTVLLTDTVGFVRKLPHHLVNAFKSTLDEAKYADIVLIVEDITDSESEAHLEVTRKLLCDLNASDKPTLLAYNKSEGLTDEEREAINRIPNTVAISAKNGLGIDILLEKLTQTVRYSKRELTLLIPYDEQAQLSKIYECGIVKSTDYTSDGVLVTAVLDSKFVKNYEKYFQKS